MGEHPDQRADLVWSRLTAWRQAVARIFEDRKCAERLELLRKVRIAYSAPEQPSATYYLAGWFRLTLRDRVEVDVVARPGLEYAGIAAIQLSGEGFEASVTISDRNTAETRV